MVFVLPVAALALSSLALTACGPAKPADQLTGTSWQLLGIDSMAPAEEPSTTIDEPGLYMVTFGDDGRATFQVHCNRGSSTWHAEAAAPDSGSLTFRGAGPDLDVLPAAVGRHQGGRRTGAGPQLSDLGRKSTCRWRPTAVS